MKFGQILVQCLTNISNMFLIQSWRLEVSSRPFQDLIKMTMSQDIAILIVDIYHLTVFQLISTVPQISAASMSIYIEISASL